MEKTITINDTINCEEDYCGQCKHLEFSFNVFNYRESICTAFMESLSLRTLDGSNQFTPLRCKECFGAEGKRRKR